MGLHDYIKAKLVEHGFCQGCIDEGDLDDAAELAVWATIHHLGTLGQHDAAKVLKDEHYARPPPQSGDAESNPQGGEG